MRARVDVSEIEAKTKIRAKYLRALENEEWGLLPGPTFVKSFLRTYAQALDLDAKALVEEYRLHHERQSELQLEPIVSSPQGTRPGRRTGSGPRGGPREGPSRAYVAAVSAIGLVIVALAALLIAGGGGGSTNTQTGSTGAARTAGSHGARGHGKHHARSLHAGARAGVVSLALRASGVVYVCLIGDDGRRLIAGTELQPGQTTPTYHARRFVMTLGNSSLTMIVDGVPRTVAPSAQAIGYSLTKAYGRRPLAAGQLPTCT